MNILETKNLTKNFGGLIALNDVNISVKSYSIVSIIGPNGAGKTTLFNCITGLTYPDSGDAVFSIDSKKYNLSKLKSYEITKIGIARTFQNIKLFGKISSIENIMVGKFCRTKTGVFSAIFRNKFVKEEENKITKDAMELLDFVGLKDKEKELAHNLSYGDQKRLEIARALATEPNLLLLDEPAAGMNPQETKSLMELIKKIRDKKITIILIEHDMKVVMNISEEIFVLNCGSTIAKGTASEIQNNKDVISAYLGEP